MNHNLVVVIPVYNEGPVIRDHFIEIRRILQADGIECCFLIVDDGSVDNTWYEVKCLTKAFDNVFSLRLARNFGKEAAICAGLETFEAQLYIIMDSDLQHPPRYVKDMLALMEQEKANIVNAVKETRGEEPVLYRLTAKCFYSMLKIVTGIELNNSSDFKIIDRNVVDALKKFGESIVFFRGLISWVGFKSVPLYFSVDKRRNGATRFSLKKLMKLAANSILAYTSKPLFLTIWSGLFFLIFALILGVQTLFNYFSGRAVSGFSTVILLLLFVGSMTLLSLGIIGLYISRIYEEVKQRPKYIISERAGSQNNQC